VRIRLRGVGVDDAIQGSESAVLVEGIWDTLQKRLSFASLPLTSSRNTRYQFPSDVSAIAKVKRTRSQELPRWMKTYLNRLNWRSGRISDWRDTIRFDPEASFSCGRKARSGVYYALLSKKRGSSSEGRIGKDLFQRRECQSRRQLCE